MPSNHLTELFEYVRAYTNVFCEAKAFPECKTLLNAVADANNRNAFEKALRTHVRELKRFCGVGQQYREAKTIRDHHQVCLATALEQFDNKATYGPSSEIRRYRLELMSECSLALEEMLELNKERDPFKNLVIYTPAIVVAGGAWVLRFLSDSVLCGWTDAETPEFDFEYADVCDRWSKFLVTLYAPIFFFIFVAVAVKGNAAVSRIKDMFNVVTTVGQAAIKAKAD